MERAPPRRHDDTMLPRYGGHCRRCGRAHQLANDTRLALTALDDVICALERDSSPAGARRALDASGGKMIGVLVVDDGTVLRAFSGELGGSPRWDGWAGPVQDRAATSELEAETLARIAEIEAELAQVGVADARRRLDEQTAHVEQEAALRREVQRLERAARQAARAARADERSVERMAQQSKRLRKEANAADRAKLDDLRRLLDDRQRAAQLLKDARRSVSATLMAAMLDATWLTNARGERRNLKEIFSGTGIPSGTGECAAPKLLEAANRAGLRPRALVEAWWEPSGRQRPHCGIEPPCVEKCTPILGHLLCGRDAP